MQEQIWQVDLPANHPEYQQVLLKRELPDNPRYTVVMVRLPVILELHKGDTGFTLLPVNNWPKGKLVGLFNFLNPKDGACYMPRLHFHLEGKRRNQPEPQSFSLGGMLKKLIGLDRKQRQPVTPTFGPYIGFTNGRHRTYYLHHVGVQVIPVETDLDSAKLLQQYCGV